MRIDSHVVLDEDLVLDENRFLSSTTEPLDKITEPSLETERGTGGVVHG